MVHPHNEPPLNPMPPVVMALFIVIVGAEAVLSLGAYGFVGGPGAVGWRIDAMERFAFSAPVLQWMIQTGQFPVQHVIRLFSYPFVHGNFTHALFAGVMLLAMGKMVAEALGALRTLAIFFAATLGGALAYGLLLETRMPLIGAFPPVYGLIGAFTYLLWLRLGQMGAQQIRAFSLIGMLLFIQLVFGLIFGGSQDWVADLGGFATGFALALVLVPGGWTRLLGKFRRD
ncbi:rhomboid family intramembrane serine protease [Salipiger sp. P9]|uniref:rhomboid family intramembrane serine protease n=1 Tax=Salipiger pentaromativorans TaxID=2943193 RepID=UPI0021587EF0|nr:rhomboid family intramembrane serine protease [Salipiger pentaromativorans]MCR8546681.1 rhomboid family intramembrane serine protease [Salipiger pentaromativorans]